MSMIRLAIMDSFSEQLLSDEGQAFSFVNFASIGRLFREAGEDPQESLHYFCDGMLMSNFVSRLTGQSISRVSFDFTSIAPVVFRHAELHRKRVFFLGATPRELGDFLRKLKARYPQLVVAGREHGYFRRDETPRVVQTVLDSRCHILIVGLGAGRQEDFIRQVRRQGFRGVAFSCGAFIRQEAMARDVYYPPLINQLNLRAFYRMYREPHTILRYLLLYPTNFLRLNYLLARRRLEINVTPARKKHAHPVHS
ncbi:MAG TPA: WecB/TagA/CpsF family glycosyltransferase [Pseudomonas sp.]|nr:WecB/TagA/CpsF family glycosyltransferase [Pseudomonas sp.]